MRTSRGGFWSTGVASRAFRGESSADTLRRTLHLRGLFMVPGLSDRARNGSGGMIDE
jgi:hypothetical protein